MLVTFPRVCGLKLESTLSRGVRLGESDVRIWAREAVTKSLEWESQGSGQAAEPSVPMVLCPPSASCGSRPGRGEPPLALTPWVSPQAELKSQEAQSLQQQRDQYLSHLQQYAVTYQQHVAAYQQLASEKEELHKQVLLQTQLMDQLQHEEVQVKMEASMARQELQETQVRDVSGGLLSSQVRDVCPFSLFFSWPLRSAWKLPASRIRIYRPS